MSISFTGNGGAMTILGAYFCAMRAVNGVRQTADPASATTWGSGGPQIRNIHTAIGNIISAHSSAQQSYYDGIRAIEAGFLSGQDQTIAALKTAVASELISIVNADNPQPDRTLPTAMKEFIRQMVAGSQTVKRCVVGQSVTAGGSNVGTAQVYCSVTGRYGTPLEYAIAETLVATCTGDANGAGTLSTAGSEPISIGGPAIESNKWAADWPLGSGAAQNITVIDPNSTSSNVLVNSNFESWTGTANVPDSWTVLVGTPGTDILKSTAHYYGAGTSATALEFVGGATLTSLAQPFDASAGAGSTFAPIPNGVHAVNFFLYTDVQPAAGVLKIELVDGSNTVINDDAGTANAISTDLHAMSATTWTAAGGFFRLPTNLPTTVKLRIRLSTAMSAGSNLWIDFGAMSAGLVVGAGQMYAGGPYVAAFRGSVDLIYGDRFTIAVTNDRAGIFQTSFERAFDMSNTLQMILPSASSSTINDNLVA